MRPTETDRVGSDPPPAEEVAPILRERLYGSLSCLSTLLVLVRHLDETSAGAVLLDIAVAAGGLWAACLLADYVAHLAAHGTRPQGRDAVRLLRASSQILEASMVPAVLVLLSLVGVLELTTAVRASIIAVIVALGLFALLAVRRTGLSWWRRTVILVALVGLGALVVGIKTLAHG